MSGYSVYSVTCDKCENEFEGTRDEKARPVRAAAKAAGWKVGKQKDFCPTCKEAIQEAIKQASAGN